MKRYTKPKIKEADITKQIRDYLNYKNIFHWKQWQGSFSKPGISDIIGIYKGIPLFLEIKTPNGKLSKHQKEFLAEVNENGGLGVVLRYVEDCIYLVEGLFNGKDLSDLRETLSG